MEKISIGWQMATRWNDASFVLILMFATFVMVVCNSLYNVYFAYTAYAVDKQFNDDVQHYLIATLTPFIVIYFVWNFWYHAGDGNVETEKYVVFNHEKYKRMYANRRIPVCELYELYFDGYLNWNPDCEGGDCYKILHKHRHKFVNYKTTLRQFWWLVQQTLPFGGGHGHGNSSQKDVESTTKEIAEHYDRGNAFFNAFMGNAMVYTSGVFHKVPKFASDGLTYAESAADGTLEEAQFNKMELICNKLQVKPGEKFLDIGCGWGTLTRHAVYQFGAEGTGVTLSKEGKKWCDQKSKDENTPTEILHMDYRNIPKDRKFDKISCVEMAEHVGLQNFVDPYLSGVKRLLKDDGLFFMQVAGLRQGSSWADVAWGLFMSKYIFPGADASTPLNWYIRQLELAGMEVRSVETIGQHYSHTLHKWYDNWMSHKDEILSGKLDCENGDLKGERLFRMWEYFLASSVIAAGRSATCYQIIAHKNTDEFDRDIWCRNTSGHGGRLGMDTAHVRRKNHERTFY